MTISTVGPCPLKSFFRETAMIVNTFLMPSFEEFQDGSPPVLFLGSKADRAIKDPFVLGLVGLSPFWGLMSVDNVVVAFWSVQTFAELWDVG